MENKRKIITPRGTFEVEEYAAHTWQKEEQLNKEGFYYWFSKIEKDYIDKIYIKQGKLPIKYKVLKSVEVHA